MRHEPQNTTRSFILIISLFLSFNAGAQNVLKSPAAYFPDKQAKVLVVGVFHFDYPGLDVIKTDEEDKIDVLKDPKKSEVTELVEYLKAFDPNKIAIEAHEHWDATEKLRAYKKGSFRDQRDERFQLAMRIATDLDIDTLYPVDARTLSEDLYKIDSTYIKALGEGYDFTSEDPFDQMFEQWIKTENKAISKVHLIDYLLHMNSPVSHQFGYGAYLVGDFRLGEFRGADILSIWWYNRNLRIFRNIQKITESPDDRIMVIIGNGHAAILRQLFECSPEYRFVELSSLKPD